MPATQSAPRNINDLFEVGKNAKENAYIQRLIHDEDLRDNAIAALQSARSAFDRANNKNWDKNKLAGDKKLRKDLQSAVLGLKATREDLLEGPTKKRHPLRKLVMIAIIGGAIALVASPDIRKKVLDALFGAEEEFEYKSATTSTNGAS
jgi:predicted phage tail protein